MQAVYSSVFLLRMICDREDEINAFIPEEYWNLEADLLRKGTRSLWWQVLWEQGLQGSKAVIRNKEELDQISNQLEDVNEVEEVKRGAGKGAHPVYKQYPAAGSSKVLNFSTKPCAWPSSMKA